MNRKGTFFRLIFWATAFVAAACPGARAAQPTTSTLKVIVSILPQADCVRRLGGDRVRVQLLVAPGQNPHAWNPTPRQLTDLAGARLWFRIGMPFEDALAPTLQGEIKGLRVVDTRQGIAMIPMAGDDTDADGDHAPGAPDPHFWLDPMRVKRFCQTMRDALAEADPAGRSLYETRYAALAAQLDRLDARLRQALAPYKGKAFFVYHPAFGYFADRYGLKQEAVELGGKEPGPRHLARLIQEARRRGVRVIFVQPQFSPRSAEALAQAIGGAVVTLDDLPTDLIGNFDLMTNRIEKAFGQEAAPPAAGKNP